MELESLARWADDSVSRDDISEETISQTLADHEQYGEFLENNPNCYASKDELDQVKIHNKYIRYMLMLKRSEFLERKYKNG